MPRKSAIDTIKEHIQELTQATEKDTAFRTKLEDVRTEVINNVNKGWEDIKKTKENIAIINTRIDDIYEKQSITSRRVDACKNDILKNKEEAQIGLVIIAVLSEFKDIWASRKADGTITIEQMDGPVCKFTISEGKVKFKPASFQEVEPSIKSAIQKKFMDLINELK